MKKEKLPAPKFLEPVQKVQVDVNVNISGSNGSAPDVKAPSEIESVIRIMGFIRKVQDKAASHRKALGVTRPAILTGEKHLNPLNEEYYFYQFGYTRCLEDVVRWANQTIKKPD